MKQPNFAAMSPVVAKAIEQMMARAGRQVLAGEGQSCRAEAPYRDFPRQTAPDEGARL